MPKIPYSRKLISVGADGLGGRVALPRSTPQRKAALLRAQASPGTLIKDIAPATVRPSVLDLQCFHTQEPDEILHHARRFFLCSVRDKNAGSGILFETAAPLVGGLVTLDA
jgi:hypothetical protein